MSEEGEKSAPSAMTTAVVAGAAIYRLKARGLGRETVVDLWDDLSGEVAATTTFTGKPVFATMTIDCGPVGGRWRAAPNRAVMPTSWRLEPGGDGPGAMGGTVTVFSRPVGPALLNPFARELLSLERSGDRLVVLDARKSQLGRILNLESSDWVLARGGQPVAVFGFARDPKLSAPSESSGGGPLGRLRRATRKLVPGDRALRSVAGAHVLGAADAQALGAADAHVLGAAEALVLLLLVAELTQPTG